MSRGGHRGLSTYYLLPIYRVDLAMHHGLACAHPCSPWVISDDAEMGDMLLLCAAVQDESAIIQVHTLPLGLPRASVYERGHRLGFLLFFVQILDIRDTHIRTTYKMPNWASIAPGIGRASGRESYGHRWWKGSNGSRVFCLLSCVLTAVFDYLKIENETEKTMLTLDYMLLLAMLTPRV